MIKITTDKKINRLDRLSDYREVKLPVGINITNGFYVEVSTKAFNWLKDNNVSFRVCHDFDTKKCWLDINGEGANNKYDFTYLINGKITTAVNGWDRDKFVCIEFSHIDVSAEWGVVVSVVELLGEWLDKKHGDDLGFKRDTRNGTVDFATLRKSTSI